MSENTSSDGPMDPGLGLTDDECEEMVDERVCRILMVLRPPEESARDATIIASFLADAWACLEVAARVVAPAFGLDPMDDDLIRRVQRAAHDAMKATCVRIADERPSTTEP